MHNIYEYIKMKNIQILSPIWYCRAPSVKMHSGSEKRIKSSSLTANILFLKCKSGSLRFVKIVLVHTIIGN